MFCMSLAGVNYVPLWVYPDASLHKECRACFPCQGDGQLFGNCPSTPKQNSTLGKLLLHRWPCACASPVPELCLSACPVVTMPPAEKTFLLCVVVRGESSRFSNLRYSCVSSHKLNGVTFTLGPVCFTRAEGGFKFSPCYPEHLCSHLNWFLTSINSAGTVVSICFNFQAPPAPHKWAFMEYLKTLIFCALLANYLLRAFYSAIVHGAFMCGEGTEPPVGQTDADEVRKAVWLGRGAVGVVLVYQMGTSPAGSSSGGAETSPWQGHPPSPNIEGPPNPRWCWVQCSGLWPWQPSPLLWHAREPKSWSL